MSTLAHEGLLGNPTLKIISAARWHVHTYLIGDGITGHPANLQTAPPVEGPAIPPLPPWHAAPPVEGPAIPPLPHWRAAVALACVPTPATAPQAPEATPPPSRAVAALAAVPKAAPKPATKPDPQADAEMAAIRSRCAALAEEAWPDYVADLRAPWPRWPTRHWMTPRSSSAPGQGHGAHTELDGDRTPRIPRCTRCWRRRATSCRSS